MSMRKSPSSWRQLTIFLLALVLAFVSIASADGPNPIRIMPLGDSITYGSQSAGTVGYRRPLYQSLIGAGYSVDFVGSQTDGSPEDFDRNHEGHRGWRADQIRDNITGWLNSAPADVILLHIGTNDITQYQGATSTAADIGKILDNINTWETAHNQVWVVLARIINRNDSLSGVTTTLNGLIQNLANERIAAGDKIVVVNMESALSYPGDLSDTVHPNDTGYGKMAAVWSAALEALPILLPNPDHDGDGDVDGSDLALFIAAFGSATGDLNYDARCDLNSNGTIHEDDLPLFPFGVSNLD
jgi:lysophospholipase L1-like esterase